MRRFAGAERRGREVDPVEPLAQGARDLMVQEVGFDPMLQAREAASTSWKAEAADSPTSAPKFLDDTPIEASEGAPHPPGARRRVGVRRMARLIRQAEFGKAVVVAKLRGARDRKWNTGVKVEGRTSSPWRTG